MQLNMMTFPLMVQVQEGSLNLDDLCGLAMDCGIRALDLLSFEIDLFGRQTLKDTLSRYNLRLNSYISFIPFITDTDCDIIRQLDESIAVAQELQAKILMIMPYSVTVSEMTDPVSQDEKKKRLVKYYTIAVEKAKNTGVTVCFENAPYDEICIANAKDCLWLLEHVPDLKLVFDTGNMICIHEDPFNFYSKISQYICYIHLKDIRYAAEGSAGDRTIDGKIAACCLWGEGIVPIRKILKLLKKDGYQGTAAIEYCAPSEKADFEAHANQMDRYTNFFNRIEDGNDESIRLWEGKVFSWAYIGTGNIAQATASRILPTGHHKIVSVYSKTYEKCKDFAEEHGAKACRSLQEAVKTEKVDAVYVATTADNHLEIARECLDLGKPVLLEKPFTINARQAKELFAFARERKLYIAEAMWTWYSAVSNQVKEWIVGGAIGDVSKAELRWAFPAMHMDIYKRLKDPNVAGGSLLDCGIYPITYCWNLFGNPIKISCIGKLEDGVDLFEDIELTYKQGLVVHIYSTIADFLGENAVFTGSQGTIRVPWFHGACKAILQTSEKKIICEGNGGYESEFDRVAEEIMLGLTDSRFVPPTATMEILAILDECRRQLGLRYPSESE